MSNNDFYEIVKYLIPQIGLLALVYLFLNNWKQRESTASLINTRNEAKRLLLPNQIHAFERMVLFLERISPQHIIPRLNQSNLSASEFQYILTKEIATEYEHNLSQQLYVPENTWKFITLTKERTIQEILLAAQSLPKEATSKDLALKILNNSILSGDKSSINEAILMLKKDLFKIS